MVYEQIPKDFHAKFEVASCFCEYKGKFILLQTSNDKLQGGTWGVPAGKKEKNETILEAISREIQEETGILVNQNLLKWNSKVFIKWPEFDYIYHLLSIRFTHKPEIKLHPREHSAYKWVTPEEAFKTDLMRDEGRCIELFYRIKAAF